MYQSTPGLPTTSPVPPGKFEITRLIGMDSAMGTMPTFDQEREPGLQQLRYYAMELESRNRILEGQYNGLV